MTVFWTAGVRSHKRVCRMTGQNNRRAQTSMTAPTDTPLHERLTLMVQHALPGTLIPVDSIRALLVEDRLPARVSVPGISLVEVAERCACLGSRKQPVKPSAVRKWMRTGLRGVRLSAFAWGKTFRVHERALEEFIRDVQNASAGGHGGNVDEELSRLDSDIAASRRRAATTG